MSQNVKLKLNTKVVPETKAAAARGLLLGAEHVLQVSNQRVPHEEGTLERSGVASVDPGKLEAAISYDTPYAVRQHEDMTLHHDAGRQAKYLESALNGERDKVAQIVAQEIRQAMK